MTRMEIHGYGTPVVDRGPRDGLPVVFVHGFPFSHVTWEAEVASLSDVFRAVAYDVRGLGNASVGDGQYTMELYVDDLVALLDALELETAVVCGLSMGGYIGLRFAEREADRLRGLVLCDTRSAADDDEGKLKRAGAIRRIKADGIGPFADTFPERVLSRETLRERPELVAGVREIIRSCSPRGVCGAQLAMAGRTDTTAALSGIGVPVLFLVGEEDVSLPPERSRRLADALPRARLVELPGAGHLSALERPSRVTDLMLEFLRALE